MTKRILSLTLIFTIILCTAVVSPVFAILYNGVLQYGFVADGAVILEVYTSTSGTLEIPSELGGYPVTRVGESAFAGCNLLEKIIFPDTLNTILGYAFDDCAALKSITIPDSVTSIGKAAFQGCTSLTEVKLPKNITNLSMGLFSMCTSLETVEIPSTVTVIDDHCFYRCENLTSIEIPYGVEVIEAYTFTNCNSLTDIKIPESVKTIEQHAFANCTDMEKISLPSGLTTIEKDAFRRCESLSEISIPDGVETISNSLFNMCTSLKSVKLPKNLKTIDSWAFYRCTALKSIDIPMGTSTIADDAFHECFSIERVSLPNSLRTIGGYAFYRCEALKSVRIPDGVTFVGISAFRQCISLESAYIGEGVTTLEMDTFCDCALTQVSIPESVTKIDYSTFSYCRDIKDVYYAGSRRSWSRIDILSGNSYLTNATIHYGKTEDVNKIPDGYHTPAAINNITINGKGTAYGTFDIKNTDGTVAKNKTVSYTIDGGAVKTAKTNAYGKVQIAIDNITKSKNYSVKLYGNGIRSHTGTVSVTVEPMHFTSGYEGVITRGAGAGIGLGVGGEVGPFKAKMSLAEAGIDASNKILFSVSQEYANDKNKLSLVSKRNFDAAVAAKVGVFAQANAADNVAVNASLIDANGKAAFGKSRAVGFQDDNFDINNANDIKDVAIFLLCALIDGMESNAATQYIVSKINPPTNYNESGATASLGAGANIGVVGVNVGGVGENLSLGGINSASVWSASKKQYKDNSYEYNSNISAEKGLDMFSTGTGVYGFGGKEANNIALTAKSNPSGQVTSLGISASNTQGERNSWLRTTLTESEKISYENAAARNLVASYAPFENFATGYKGFFSLSQMKKAASQMTNSDETAKYSASSKRESGFDFNLPVGFEAVVQISGKIGLSGFDNYEYETTGGIYENNVVYIQNENDIRADIEAEVLTIEDLFDMSKNIITDTISSMWDTIGGWVSDAANAVVDAGKAVVKSVADGAKSIYVTISSTVDDMVSLSVLAVDSEVSLFSTSSLATTIGNPYIINTKDENGYELTDFSDSPLMLTLYYTLEDLAEAGVTDVNEISVLRWDDDKAVYVYAGGEVNAAASCVDIEITKPGQYILAVDNCAPAITQFCSSDTGATPEISATVSDMSGIADFTFKIDGATVLTTSDFAEYYDYTTGEFCYKTASLADGTHTATIYATDTLGNSIEETIEFTVWSRFPTISDVTELPSILADEVIVSASVSDSDLTSVFLNIEVTDVYGETIVFTEEMSQLGSVFQSVVPQLPDGYEVKVWITAYNTYGNMTESEKQSAVVLSAESGIVITNVSDGNVAVMCGDTMGDVYLACYGDDGVITYADIKPCEETVTFENVPAGYDIRVFSWSGMTPLSNSVGGVEAK